MGAVIKEARRGQRHIDTDSYNAIIEAVLSRLEFDPRYFRYFQSGARRMVSMSLPAEFPWDSLAFWHTQIAPNQIEVNPGTIRAGAIGNFPVAGGVVTFTGATEWVYVTINRGFGGPGNIAHSSTEPISTTASYRWPLVKYVATGSVWDLDADGEGIHHFGDIFVDVPTL